MSKLRAFTMPKWGIEMTEGSLAEWQIAEGESFAQGQVLAAVETDKIVNEVEADYAAVCLRLIAATDTDYPVGALLAVFGEADASPEEVDRFIAQFHGSDELGSEAEDQRSTDTPNQPNQRETQAETQGDSSGNVVVADVYEVPDDLRISAKARELAQSQEVDFANLTGSGNKGRILLQDIQQQGVSAYQSKTAALDNGFIADAALLATITPIALKVAERESIDYSQIGGSGKNRRIRLRDLPRTAVNTTQVGARTSAGAGEKNEASGVVEKLPFSRMRRHIAERLTRSQAEIPHYFLEIDFDAQALVTSRDHYNQAAVNRATFNDVILLAVARTLAKHPKVNINVGDGEIFRFSDINLAIAVSIKDGLVTPVVKRANSLSLAELSVEAKRLIDGARAGNLKLPDYAKGTFTVSNLGMHGIKRFTSIINPPQAAILSVGQIRRAPIETATGVEFGWQLSLTMACDHRVIDGTTGTNMLESLKALLESPESLFSS